MHKFLSCCRFVSRWKTSQRQDVQSAAHRVSKALSRDAQDVRRRIIKSALNTMADAGGMGV